MIDYEEAVLKLLDYVAEDRKTIARLLDLVDRQMKTSEDHQLRIGRLEQMLSRKEKRVSLFPGDREQ